MTQQDAALLEQYLLGDLAFSRYGMTLRADMDGDGRVNGFDLRCCGRRSHKYRRRTG
ncbi:MAG: dockerin type I domain-containing protein [Ruminococcus callidus]